MISGYSKGQIIAAGSIHKLLCVSSGGNPPPTMVWYKNDKKINSVTKIVTNSVSAEITILANATDNQARYKCEVQNSATEIPFFETKTLDVHCKYNKFYVLREMIIHGKHCLVMLEVLKVNTL